MLYDFNALIELEELYGDMQSVFEGLESFRMKVIRDMVWAGLLHEDEGVTPRDVGKMLHPGNIAGVAEKITEAIYLSLPEAEAEDKGKPGE